MQHAGNGVADGLRAAIGGADRASLPEVSRRLWQAVAAGEISDHEAEHLDAMLRARTAPSGALGGSRTAAVPIGACRSIFPARRLQRAPDRGVAMERRRRLAASGPMPPTMACRYTVGQLAALRIVADEVACNGTCGLCIDALAARAGISRRLAQVAIRLAEGDGLLVIREQRLPGQKNDPNTIRIISGEWLAWIQRGRRSTAPRASGGIGCRKLRPTDTDLQNQKATARPGVPGTGSARGASGPAEGDRRPTGSEIRKKVQK